VLTKALFEESFGRERKKHRPVLYSPALLVIDLQNYFSDRKSRAYLEGIETVVVNTGKLIEGFVSCRLPVASTVHRGGSKMMEEWWGNTVADNWAVPQFSDFPLFYKDSYDAFHGTGLDAFLKDRGVNQLVICGVRTHLCCETTARSAFVKDYRTVMIEDALCDKDVDQHVRSLKNLASGFSAVSNTLEILELLRRRL
jgi:isochorismate hydrolase